MYLVFPTFEISPLTNGGIGTYIFNIIKYLQNYRYQALIVLYSLNEDNAAKARQYFAQVNLKCEIFHVNEFSEMKLTTEDIYDIDKTSLSLKLCLEKIISIKNIVGIEWCDHAGVGFHTLQDKCCNPQSVFKDIVMWVHLHGTREIWDSTDRYPVYLDQDNSYVLSNYAERLSLELADAWKTPSQSIADWYINYFCIHNRVIISPLPYKKLAEQNSHSLIQLPQKPLNILCPGRIQYIKGSDIIARSCVELCRIFPNQFHVTFAGYNVPSANLNFSSSLDEIKSFIPKEFLSHFSFLGKYSSEEYLRIAQSSHLAIFASRVETFCLAAHELNWLGIPLILSDIPAFREHFQDSVNCYKFDGTFENLNALLTRILGNTELLKQIKSQPITDFNPNIFDKLVSLPNILKINSNYFLFTKMQQHNIMVLSSVNIHKANFKDLSVNSIRNLLLAAVWKVMKRLADNLSASPEARMKVKKFFKLITQNF